MATAVAVVAMALYVATLQPDFGGPEDTPKFQFLGYVLGTAHPPGYPLYVMLSHLFVQLPLGTVAYRANLFSAVMAAISCALAYGIGRQLGARRMFAAAAALGLVAGASFWRSAVFAEVYSLAAALVAGFTSVLLAWGRWGGTHRLLGAVAVFAAGLGNHLTIVGVAPAAAIYVIVKNRLALTPRVVAAAAVIAVLGVAQYGFILLRTHQKASYLESGAESVGELVGILRADRFAEQRFAFGAREVAFVNVPAVGRVLGAEFTAIGVMALLAGIIAAAVRRSADAAVVVGSAAGMFGMIVNMSGDVQGFVTPVVVLLWPMAAFGFEFVCVELSSRWGSTRVVAAVAATAALALPMTNLAANYAEADQSRQTEVAHFLRDTYAHLPDRAAIVAEDYFYDMAHEYFTTTGEAGADRGVVKVGYQSEEVRDAAADGRRVFAFAGAATILAAEGLWFERASMQSQSLEDWLRRLPNGTLLIGSTSLAAVPFDPALVGQAGARGAGRAAAFEAFVLAIGGGDARWHRDENRASLTEGGIEARADRHGAIVLSGGRPLAAVTTGAALAAFGADGVLHQALELPVDDARRVEERGAIYELKGETTCVQLTREGWQDVGAAFATGSAVVTLDGVGMAAIDVQLPRPDVAVGVSHLTGDGESSVQRHHDASGTSLHWKIARVGGRRPLFRIAFDRPLRTGRARLAETSQAARARLCAHRPSRPLAAPGATRFRVSPDFESEAFFGAGWSTAERRTAGTARRGENGAALLLPLGTHPSLRARIALSTDTPRRIEVDLDGTVVGTCHTGDAPFCEVDLPPGTGQVRRLGFTVADGAQPTTFTFHGAWFDAAGGIIGGEVSAR